MCQTIFTFVFTIKVEETNHNTTYREKQTKSKYFMFPVCLGQPWD